VADSTQNRRRQDLSGGRRPVHEQIILAIFGLLGLGAALAGVWWLWSQSIVGGVVRDGSPNWAPDGRVVFASELGGKADLYLADRSGSNRFQLTTTDGDEGGAAYSVDGQRIAFHSDREGNFEIYIRQADSETTRPLTRNPAIDQAPTWSRDGKQIVFMSDRDNPDFDIYRMNVDGTGSVERLTHGGSNRFPQYSPDGGQLLLQVDRDVYIMSLSTLGLRRVTHEPDNGLYPTWAPDGLHIAFMSWRNGHSQIFTSRPDNSDAKAVVSMPNGDAISPRWSPDGKFIAFVHVPQGGVTGVQEATQQRIVYVVELASGRVSRVSR
jgi:Tol biopolymer transport system component